MDLPFRPFLGRLKTALIRKPLSEYRRLRGLGPTAYVRLPAWQRQMEIAAHRLPVLSPPQDQTQRPLEVWFLTGSRFWYQTAFCAWSLAKYSHRSVVVNLADDGTLTGDLELNLRRLFPMGTTHWRSSLEEQFHALLPISRYPTLHQRWYDYINLHKIVTPHLGRCGVQLVLDSDMLFFAKPNQLLQWWDSISSNISSPCLMVDCEESYGYSRTLLQGLCGTAVLPALNVGICGLHSELIDWDELEFWCRSLVEAEGTSYFLEQALVAMIASRQLPVVLPRSDYITCPSREQVVNSRGVLHHYVANSKSWYFARAYKLVSWFQS